ncbi:alpha-L-fucosidase [Planoprotostelium fungivorum]|uniref:Alpha-L-fucosidase n=1 Tax=Planoprotostelium fungivorum TaxID=1890364 RepID=A0A2P6NBF6_9EUKA|nr:alpha-L-fucosidase [Planoprotostelium fungivorum]
MRSLLFLIFVTLAFSYDLSGKKVIWSDGLSAHISLIAVTPRPSTYTITAANLTTCTNWDACDPKNANPYYKNEGVAVESTWMIKFDDGTYIELCICKGWKMDQNAMAKALSYVPPSVRSSVNRVSQRPTGNGAVTFANAAIYKGEYNPEVFVHESAHSFDWCAEAESNGISSQSAWLTAIDWAQTSVLYWYLTYSKASEQTLRNATFQCWSKSRQAASVFMPYNTSREFDATEKVTITPKTSTGRLNYLKTQLVTNSTNTGGWQLVPASYNYYLLCESGDKTMSCIDNLGLTKANDAPALYYPRNGGLGQQFSLFPDGKGYHKIINRANGLALTTLGCGTAKASSTVVFGADGNNDCLLWKVVRPRTH